MLIPFLNPNVNSENHNIDHKSPYTTSMTWAIESFFIEVYFLLAHRIKGLGWSLKDFMSCDTWTTSKLYCMELEVIEKEEESLNESDDEKHDSEEVKDLMTEMYG